MQTCIGSGGVHGVPVGQEPPTNSPRMTSAEAVTDCKLLQLSISSLGGSHARALSQLEPLFW